MLLPCSSKPRKTSFELQVGHNATTQHSLNFDLHSHSLTHTHRHIADTGCSISNIAACAHGGSDLVGITTTWSSCVPAAQRSRLRHSVAIGTKSAAQSHSHCWDCGTQLTDVVAQQDAKRQPALLRTTRCWVHHWRCCHSHHCCCWAARQDRKIARCGCQPHRCNPELAQGQACGSAHQCCDQCRAFAGSGSAW